MTDPTTSTPEEYYALLFPNKAIPAWALDKMELLDDTKFAFRTGVVETIPLAQVIGTCHANYGNQLRWVDMLTKAERASSNFRLENWAGLLGADTSNIGVLSENGKYSTLSFQKQLAMPCQGLN